MTVGVLSLLLLVLAALGFVVGRQKAIASVKGDTRNLHSLPAYYGSGVALFTAVPAFLLMLVWLLDSLRAPTTMVLSLMATL